MKSLVEQKLGTSTARLYERLDALATISRDVGAEPARRALSRILLDVVCGTYHDYRSGRPMPKGDLIEAVRSVPAHPSLDGQRAAIEAEVLAGWYDEDEEENRRWVARLAPRQPGKPAPQDLKPESIELTPREYRVFVWLYRYVEVYGQSPRIAEIAAGLEILPMHVGDVLRLLERKGAAANLGGKRGWVPTRCP